MLLSLKLAYAQSLETYENPLFGFKFQYPSEWIPILFEGNTGVSFDLHIVNPSKIAVNKVVVDLPENKTMKQYLREYTPQQTGLDMVTLKLNQTTLSGLPATTESWDVKWDWSKDYWGKALTTFGIKDNTVYQIHYETGPEVFYTYLPQVKNVISSFEITG